MKVGKMPRSTAFAKAIGTASAPTAAGLAEFV
jgi:hypothetical protein